jgi:hypothetical protein
VSTIFFGNFLKRLMWRRQAPRRGLLPGAASQGVAAAGQVVVDAWLPPSAAGQGGGFWLAWPASEWPRPDCCLARPARKGAAAWLESHAPSLSSGTKGQ